MAVIDAPVHAYERNRPERPWAGFLHGPDQVTGDDMIDHLGLQQPFEPPAAAEPFAELPGLLALAAHPNVAVKISGACTLSHQAFPYDDIWDPLWRIFDAFGFDRCMCGTDWTRAVALLTYRQGVGAFTGTDRLSAVEKAALMGGTLTKIYCGSPS